MTALRPEHEAGQAGPYEQGAYGDPGAFEAAVEGLADPLNDPLPGQRRPAGQPVADPEPEWSGDYYRPYAAETPPGAGGPPGEWSGASGYYTAGGTAGGTLPSSAPAPSPLAPSPLLPPLSVPSPSISATGAGAGAGAGASADAVPGGGTAGPRTGATRRAAGPEPGAEDTAVTAVIRLEEPVAPVSAPVPAPRTGGRAERRKAAAKGGRRRRSEPAAAGPGQTQAQTQGQGSGWTQGQQGSGPGTGGPTPDRPLSRVEARRAARAAKDSLGVVASRVVGELFITFGVLMLLFVTYQLWWTNVRADVYAGKEANKIQQSWSEDRQPGTFEPGQGFAIMHIPKLDVVVPIAEGISKAKVLDNGMVGHYAEGALKTAMPSDKQGNFAVAGHRNTHGEPFRYINQLQPGDEIIVETRDAYYTYDMTSILPQTAPSNVSVIGPVPPGSGFTEPGRYITLTTCTPEFTSTYRMIVWGKMVDERPRGKGKPDALVG